MNTDILQIIGGKKMLLQLETAPADPFGWAADNKEDIDRILNTNGALLIRGLDTDTSEHFGNLLTAFFGQDLSSYTYRSTPRTSLSGNVYTATEYDKAETIPQHNENAYSDRWPLRIGFLCVTPAGKGGNTPISDSRLAYQLIPREIRMEFERKKIMYVRNYNNIDLPWTEVFQTSDKREVENYCNAHNITFEWLPTGLRTRQVNGAAMTHPVSGEKVWFNQAHLFHISNLDEEMQESLISLLGEECLPRNTYFGDGTPIGPDALAEIRKVYEDTKISFPWEKNDLLLLDNMLSTHGREPYEGTRQVLVGMSREYQSSPKTSLV